MICFDSCFPELFHRYRQEGVKILFLSYYNAKSTHEKNDLDTMMRALLITRAADNSMYISASNSSAYYSRMPSCLARPDGKVFSLKRHIPGILCYDYPEDILGFTYNNLQ